MSLTPRISLAGALLLLSACASRVDPPFARIREPGPRLATPALASNLVVNGSFEEVSGEEPAAWAASGRQRPGATVRVVKIPEAPEGERVAEIALAPPAHPDYGLFFVQDVRVEPWTTYELSVWVRGIDLVSGVGAPAGFGQHCGLFFWLLGPTGDPATRIFPSGAFPRRDGTTRWEFRRMRFTTPLRESFPPARPGSDGRFHLQLQVLLHGTGTVQVDDVRLAASSASPPPPRRGPGRLALARRHGKPFFGIGLHNPPVGSSWTKVGQEQIFNFSTGAGSYEEKLPLGIVSFPAPWMVDPACGGCESPAAPNCPYCRLCPGDEGRCGPSSPDYVASPGAFGVWIDEPNFNPQFQGDLNDLVLSARRIKKDAARRRPWGQGYYLYATDMPGAVYFNTYGWDDLAAYHASEAFDIVGAVRRGGNPPRGAVGGSMSEFPQTSINGIRQVTRRIVDDVTDSRSRQGKPVWMVVNGGSGKIITDPDDPSYPTAPHDAAQLRAFRPTLAQLRYMLYAAALNGATGLLFYQDDTDTLLTPDDFYWKAVMIPAAAELAALERQTGFLSRPDYNTPAYRLSGEADQVDSMLKRSGERWILALANSSPEPASRVEFVLEGGKRFEGPVERMVYRHHERPGRRQFEATPEGTGGGDRFLLDLPGYGVTLFRFRISEPAPRGPASGNDGEGDFLTHLGASHPIGHGDP